MGGDRGTERAEKKPRILTPEATNYLQLSLVGKEHFTFQLHV